MEIAGSWISGSQALLADAAHVVADKLAYIIAWLIAVHIRTKPTHAHWWEKVGGKIGAVLLFAAGIMITADTLLDKIWQPSVKVPLAMLAAAATGLLGNWVQLYLVHHVGSGNNNKMYRGVHLHVHYDLQQSAYVVVGGLCVLLASVFGEGLADGNLFRHILLSACNMARDYLDVILAVYIGIRMAIAGLRLFSEGEHHH